MPSSFPTSRDTLTNPTAADQKNSATVPHAAQHANANDAIEAIEAALPITSEGSVPRGLVPGGYAEVTADQTGIGTGMTDLTGLAVTFTAVAGRNYLITAHTQWVHTGSVANTIDLYLREGTTTLDRLGRMSMNASWTVLVHGAAKRTFTAGSHTLKLSSTHDGATFTLAAATVKASIRVEDIGAV